MNFVADENVDAAIVAQLRDAGHQVWYVAEAASGISDDEVLQQAVDSRAVLLTSDKDFGDLVFRQRKAMAGVLLLRLAGSTSADRARLVGETVSRFGAELGEAFSVLGPSTLRIRKS